MAVSLNPKFPQVKGYRLTEQLYQASQTAVYRGIWEAQQRNVVVKLLCSDRPSPGEFARLCNQYVVTSNLSIVGVAKPLELKPWHHGYALVMEDFGGIALGEYVREQVLPWQAGLAITLQLANVLHELHQARIIHKDIKPANLLIHPETKQIQLIDFSLASLLPKETQELQTPNALEGTLAYMAPEQTGRMNRGIDYRADFYSLGVTLYELLTGQLPFCSDDPMGLVYCHLAKEPVAVHEVNAQVPAMLSAIVAKLMAKNVEERYQSALGLRHDLQQCCVQGEATGQIETFELGQRDVSDRFLIPESLYGRETEVHTLLATLERITDTRQTARQSDRQAGRAEMVLVAGFSGIGKTAVINEVHKPITRQQGYFIQGKFDQFNRGLPLSAFVDAFQNLIAQLYAESAQDLAHWREQILSALGEDAQVLIDVLPDLERIVGPQTPAARLSGKAAENRFNRLFQKFIAVFATAAHPLVIFLDDLQWADSASLFLLQPLLAQQQHLLILGAYRDNEVSAAHPLMLTVDALAKGSAAVETITLSPLSLEDVNRWVADTLRCDPPLAQPLTQLIYRKAQGNPFFTVQFLKALYEESYITFNAEQQYWECDIARINERSLTDDVVTLMTKQLKKLPSHTQELLKLAACIGNQFDLATLALIASSSKAETATALWRALEVGLILPNRHAYQFFQATGPSPNEQAKALYAEHSSPVGLTYRFLHDRVQQAAYGLIAAEQKAVVHSTIGQRLLERTPVTERRAKLFDIVNHLNKGKSLLDSPEKRLELAKLNLSAAQIARAGTAYREAFGYIMSGLALLGDQPWKAHYSLTLLFHQEGVATLNLLGEFETMNDWVNTALENTHDTLDNLPFYEAKIQSLIAQRQLAEALQLGLETLERLGAAIPQNPQPEDFKREIECIANSVGDRSVESLIHLPEMTSPRHLGVLRLAWRLSSVMLMAAPHLMPFSVFQAVQLSIESGNSILSAVAYTTYGMLLCSAVGDIETGYRFGQLGLQVVEKYAGKEVHAKALIRFISGVHHWKAPISDALSSIVQGYQLALESGDLESAAICAQAYGYHAYFAGQPLTALADEMAVYSQGILRTKQQGIFYWNEGYRQHVLNLLGRSQDPCCLIGDAYDETSHLPKQWQAQDYVGVSTVHLYKAIAQYLFAHYDSALDNFAVFEQHSKVVAAFVYTPVFHFYTALTKLALLPTDSCVTVADSTVTDIPDSIQQSQAKLQQWGKHAPMNYQHKYELVEAERLRVLGQLYQAGDFYDRAIAGAKAHGYIQEEAIANELAAKFYLDWGKEKIAAAYMQEAYIGYECWGAKAKTDDLEQRYASLLRPAPNPPNVIDPLAALDSIAPLQLSAVHSSVNRSQAASGPINSSTVRSDRLNQAFDLATILKSAQALSESINLSELFNKLAPMMLQASGAERMALLLPNVDGCLHIRVIATPDTTSLISELLGGSGDLPEKLIRYVYRTQEVLTVDGADSSALPMVDQYLQPYDHYSILCLPLMNQTKLVGLLYLEHLSVAGVFDRERTTILNFLGSQAAISLENALLNQALEHQLAIQTAKRQASEHRFQNIVENIPGVVFQTRYGTDGTISFPYVSPNCHELYEVSAEVIMEGQYSLQDYLRDFVYSEDRSMLNQLMLEFVQASLEQTSQTFECEFRILTPSGMLKWVRSSSSPRPQPDGSVLWDGSIMDVSDRKRAERASQLSAALAKATFDQAAVGFAESDLTNGKIVRINACFCHMTGYTAEELKSLTVADLTHPEDISESLEKIAQLRMGLIESFTAEKRYIRKDGSCFWASTTVSLIQSLEENSPRCLAVIQDISDRKRAERALQLSEAIAKATFDQAAVGFVEDDFSSGTIVRANECFCRMLGYTAEEIEALTVSDITHPDDRFKSREDVQQLRAGLIDSFTIEKRYIRKDQSFFWANTTVGLVQLVEEDSPRCLAVIQDISDRKAAELALKESQDRFQRISNNIPGMIYRYVVHADGSDGMPYVNSQVREIYELEPNDLLLNAAPLWERIHPDDIAWLDNAVQTSSETLTPFQVEYRVILPQKGLRWIQMFSQPKRLENGDVIWDGVAIDITDRKVTQLALQEAQDQLLRVTEKVPGMIYRYIIHADGSGEMLYVSSQIGEIYELEPEMVLQNPSLTWERKHPDDVSWLREQLYTTSQEPTKSLTLTYRLILPKKGLRWVENASSVERLDNGDVIWDGVVTDITERKEAEFALQDAQAQFRRMTENVPGMIYRYVLHPDGSEGYSYVSSQVRELYECEPEIAIDNFSQIKQRVHPDDLPKLQEAGQVSTETLQPYQVECRLILPQKGLRWVQMISLPERLDNGDIVWDGIVIDITERKQAEAQQQRQLAILESASDFIGTCDPDGKILYLNRAWRQLLQDEGENSVSRVEITEQHPDWALNLIHNEALPIAAEQGIWIGETAMLDKKGQEIPVSQVIISHKSRSGEVDYFSTIIRDISAQKAVEQELILKQNHLEALLDNIPHIAWIKDADSRFIAVNKPLAKLLNTSPEKMVGKTDFNFSPEEIAQAYQDDDAQVLRAGQRKVVEEKYCRGDGIWGWLETTKTPFRNSQGELAGTVGIAMDISDRKRYEQEILESKAFLQTILDTVPQSVFWKDGDSCYIGSNQNFAEDAGFEQAEALVGLTDFDMPWTKAEAEDYRADDQEVMQSGVPKVGIIETQVQADGSQVWLETNKLPLHDLEGNVIGVLGTYQDISDRKRAELSLQQSEEKFRTLVSNLHGAVYRSQNDSAWTINYMSDAIFDLSGYPVGDFLENNVRTYASIIHPDDVDYVEQEVTQAIAKQASFVLEYRIIHRDGSIRWVYEKGKGIFTQGNQLQYLEGVIFDISDRKHYEQEILKSKAFLQTILDTVPQSVFWKDCDSRFIGGNQNFAEDAGFENAEVIAGLTDFDMPWAETEAIGYQRDDQEVMQSDSPKIGIIETQVQANGNQVWLETNKLPLHDLDGYVIGVLGTYQDISDRKQAEAELQRTNTKLVRATRLKDEFLANMSHELRTPLNSVIGFSQLMQQDDSVAEQHKETLKIINRSGEYLLSLINDILEMSKIEAGRTTLNLQPVDLPRLLNELKEMLQIKADAKYLSFHFSYADDTPDYIQADEVKLRQILLNLLSNALKFTEQGQVGFYAEMLKPLPEDAEGKLRLRFSVTDTGPGVSIESQETIFQPFVQASAGKRSHQGTGLGLPISQKFAEMMGGRLSVHSVEGQGSTFHCEICVDALSSQDLPEMSYEKGYRNIRGLKDPQARYRLLVVDDNRDNSSLLLQMLSIPGFELRMASNGREAVECNEDWQPDLIWMDIRMPIMDGLEAVRQIRSSGHHASDHQPIIIALTANAFSEEREAALAVGCDDFIPKPFAVNEVFKRLERWLAVEFLLEQEEKTNPSAPSMPKPQPKYDDELLRKGYMSMPMEWQQAFQHAIRCLNDKAITSLLSEVPEEQQAMVNIITEIQADFRHDILITLIESAP